MTRAVVLGLAVLLLPEQCNQLLAKTKKGGEPAAPSADPPAAPPPPPVTSATTPPVWTAPVPAAAPPTSEPDESVELAKAKVAAEAGEHKKVRQLLDKKVRSGKATSEEAQLLLESCAAMKDRARPVTRG